jgi:NADH:ubiquinone oxidoreductase subunit 6 (subunit J)/predicted nucleic-acid-binding Zn-ribbon protein
MNGLIEWVLFLSLSAIAIITAAGMILTMSMYRAGLALMASFVALAGLFILLNADLLAAIQVMMNVGGMLAMVLFMVMMMMDPGGEMMWGMKRDMHMPGPAAFSMHIPRGRPPEEQPASQKEQQVTDWTCPMHAEISQLDPGSCPKCGMTLITRAEMADAHASQEQDPPAKTYTCPMHPEVQQNQPGSCPKCGMTLIETAERQSSEADGHQDMPMESTDHSMHSMAMNMHAPDGGGHDMDTSNHDMNMSGMTPRQYYDMMVDMAMSTAQLPWAIALGIASALLLIVLVIQTPWPLAPTGPTQDATNAVGQLLLSRYMIGFEGAAFLILAAIAGAVILAKRESKPEQQPEMEQIESHEQGADKQLYTCPMHPKVREPHPGNCPKCGMTLIAVEETIASGTQSKHGGHS